MFGLTPYESRKNQVCAGKPRDIFDLFFRDDCISAFTGGISTNFNADIKDLDKEYVIEAEMPGLTKDDVKLDLNGDILTITAEKREDSSDENGRYIRRERKYGAFTRSFRFDDIDRDGASAKFENGVLRVALPKQVSASEQRKSIDIG
jgi:HSP20 family protein